MKALVYVAEKQLEVRDVPEPQGEFLVRVLGCAICGTDLKTLLHGHPYFKPPTILGHEFYGVVDKAPAGCGYAPGDYVASATNAVRATEKAARTKSMWGTAPSVRR